MKFNFHKLLLGAGMALATTVGQAQLLEDIIVETYYISDADDATDTDGGSLPVGSTTYRIFVDMAPGAELETIFGNSDHTLFINSTTGFFNNEDRGATIAEGVGTNRLGDNTVAVDSWVSFGGASSTKLGVLKSADTDGSIVGGANNDGGSAGIGSGLLKNADPNAGIPLTTSDGLITGTPPATGTIGLDVTMFDAVNSTVNFSTNNGAWFTLGGTQGVDPTGTNRLLVAQITVLGGGQLSFELNMRLNDGQGGAPIDYVANNPQAGEVVVASLTFPQAANDCLGVPGGSALPGTSCDDGNANTVGETWDANCNCTGGQVIDCEGNAGGPALPGTPCDDNSLCTTGDTWDANCNCVGTPVDPDDGDPCTLDTCDPLTGVSNVFQDADGDGTCDANDVCPGSPEPGQSCDDGNANTINDVVDANCVCAGTPLVVDCEGTPGGNALPGTPCDDLDANTVNDTWDANCNCVGQVIDCEGNAGGPALPGTPCDDNSLCTTGDTWDANCNCVGTPVDPDDGDPCTLDTCDPLTGVSNVFQDADGDGTCDANDVCPGSPEPGQSCDDGNANTINDVVDANCVCAGTPLTVDCEGTPGGSALPGTPCDDLDPNTTGDTWDANCNCVGTSNVDCEGIPGGNALPGTPCDDGDLNTVGETWDANCNCTGGQLVDCEGTPGGSVLPGSPCDDNNAFTSNDVYDANCNCVGTLPTACDGQPGGLEDIIVETYYIADANDAADTDGGGNLAPGATTYRIYVDMAPGYRLETMFGNSNHPLQLQTSTFFYNQEDRGEATGDLIDNTRLVENTLAIDSWLTFGAAADNQWGILKADDPDGSIVGGVNNDGGSNNVAGGLLVNNDPNAGIPLTQADGLEPAAAPVVGTIGFPSLDAFQTNTESSLLLNNGAWFVLGGITGQDVAGDNRVLVAQITTNGDFSFELNLRLGVPGGGTEDWVASNPLGNERTCASLTFQATACPPAGTPCDDGDANTINDVEDGFCNCAGTPIGGNSEVLELTIRTDDFGSETTWEVILDANNTVVASGGPYANVPGGEVIVETFSVAPGTYRLEVTDANGISNGGGYVLRDALGQRIRIGNGLWSGTSATQLPFEVPLGPSGLLELSSCDRTDNQPTRRIYTQPVPGATAYRFRFQDAHGTYVRNCAVPLPEIYPFIMYTNPIPFDLELNVQVSANAGGSFGPFGRACTFFMPSQPACPTTQLIDDQLSALYSCGRNDVAIDGTDGLTAMFVLGANKYQFRFENQSLGYVRNIASNNRNINTGWGTLPLQPGTTYDVRVRVSFDGGQTYCPFGQVCQITTLAGTPSASRELTFDEGTGTTLTMWPNPNREDVLYIKLEGLQAEQQDITIDLVDLFGKRVFSQELDNAGSVLNHAIDLNEDLAPGMYLVNIQVNGERFTQRLVRQ